MRVTADPHAMQRFIDAQRPVYATVLAELRAGRKRSHWMWFIFPQLAGLGHSDMARRYAIASLDEARAYLAHPLLGTRLRECATLAFHVPVNNASEIFPYPDDLKFHSCMTLFSQVEEGDGGVFAACLQKYFGGQPDPSSRLHAS